MKKALAWGMAGVVFGIPMNGAVLFQQAPFRSEVAGLTSTVGGQQMADDFRATTDVAVTGVNWHGFYIGDASQPHRFRIAFYPDAEGMIANQPSVEFTTTPTVTFAFRPAGAAAAVSSFAAVIPRVTFRANEQSWVSIVDLDSSATEQFRWQESELGRLSGLWASRPSGEEAWTIVNGGNLAFSLDGEVVPEPTTGLLFGVGAVAVGVALTRRSSGGRAEFFNNKLPNPLPHLANAGQKSSLERQNAEKPNIPLEQFR
jgi:hypothetical protein